MRKTTLNLTLFLFAGALAFAQTAPVPAKPKLEMLSWLSGCWTNTTGPTQRDEVWMKPAGGTMLGTGRTVAKGKTREFEFMRLHQEGEDVFFTALPSGQSETSFKLIAWDNGKFVFANPQHDFPQRVIYQHQPNGALLARIEGDIKGKLRAIDFPFQRGKCNE